MYIKINFNEEGAGAFIITFEHDLAEEDVNLSEEVTGVLVSSSHFEAYGLKRVISNAVDFLLANAHEMAGHIADTYELEEEGELDEFTNSLE